jgi:3-dehydroquinate synthase
MIKKFKIEGKTLSYETSNLYKNKFEVKSMPEPYKVEFKNNIESLNHYFENKFTNVDSRYVVWDSNLFDLYNNTLKTLKHKHYSLKALESNKNSNSVFKLIDILQSINFTKKEVIVSVGGGITQDVTAFTRSIYKRGLNWTFVPTTLLSMADSCIGAKTALNHKGVKNQLALFSAPKEVLICSEFLNTLSPKDILSGYGEILKLVIIGGNYAINEFFQISNSKLSSIQKITKLIKLSLQIKKVIIEKDEFEFDIRRSLNYGHTIGHAIEPVLKYKIPHGIAVSIGMIIENNIAVELGYLERKIADHYNNLIEKYIPIESWRLLKKINYQEVYSNILQDKKTLNKTINFAVPNAFNSFGILKVDKDSFTSSKLKHIFSKSTYKY